MKMADKQNHRELLSSWDIKSGPLSNALIRKISGSWSCPHCTYLNTASTTLDVCLACENICASRRYEVHRQKIYNENQAVKAAHALSVQNDLLNDLFEDSEDEEKLGIHNTSLVTTPIIPGKFDHLSVAPLSAGKQLHDILLSDLLLDCLSYLPDPRDIRNVMLVCKYFSFIADSDIIWWCFQPRFINDSSSAASASTADLPNLPSPPSSSSSIAGGNIVSGNDLSGSDTWICTVCQLTQALASSATCEMCHAERPAASISTQHDLPAVLQTAFIIVKSAEHLAALWVEGNKRSRERENNFMHITSTPHLQLSCATEEYASNIGSDSNSCSSAGNINSQKEAFKHRNCYLSGVRTTFFGPHLHLLFFISSVHRTHTFSAISLKVRYFWTHRYQSLC